MISPAASGSPAAGQRRWPLPAEVSGFVGRPGELARLAGLLEEARLVTVAGPGGVGKTRLALRAAADGARAEDSCLVELSGLTDPGLLPGTVALGLGLQRADAASPLETVLSGLRGRELLLILDTCEHLTGACAGFAAAVLRETSGVRILVTSRQPLHVPGEQVLRLEPLPVPGTDDGTVAGAGPGDAVELFTQRAAAAVSGYTLAPADLPHVIRLCRRLDGIPLAIELAAVRVRALPVAELAARVDAGLASGTGDLRPGGGAGRGRRRRGTGRAGRPDTGRAAGQVGRAPRARRPLPVARLGARVRRRAAGRQRRGRHLPGAAPRPVPDPEQRVQPPPGRRRPAGPAQPAARRAREHPGRARVRPRGPQARPGGRLGRR